MDFDFQIYVDTASPDLLVARGQNLSRAPHLSGDGWSTDLTQMIGGQNSLTCRVTTDHILPPEEAFDIGRAINSGLFGDLVLDQLTYKESAILEPHDAAPPLTSERASRPSFR